MDEILKLLRTEVIRAALTAAWNDSQPGSSGGHEEGGFIVQEAAGSFLVIRWPKGENNAITVPPHPGCQIQGLDIVASFHTHPNTGDDFLQEPSETDKRAVRDDLHLKGKLYQGELVITQQLLYFVTPRGTVMEIGESATMLMAT